MIEELNDLHNIHALVDGELSEAEKAAILNKIACDSKLADCYTSTQRIKDVIGCLPDLRPEPEVWLICLGRLNAIDKARRTERIVTKYAWSICGAFFLLILGGGTLNRLGVRRLGTGDVTNMASGLIPFARAQNPSSSSVGSWLQGQFGSAPLTQMPKLQVLKAEAGLVDGHRLARLTIRDESGPMVLLLIPSAESIDGLSPVGDGTPYSAGVIDQMNCLSWRQGEYAMILVGPRSTEGLEDVANQVSVNN